MKKIIYIPVSYKIKKKSFINLLICVYHDFKTLIKGLFKINISNKSTSGFVEQSLKLNFSFLFYKKRVCKLFFSKYIILFFYNEIIATALNIINSVGRKLI